MTTPQLLKDAGVIVRKHNPHGLCRTCNQPIKDGEWVFAQSETGSMEWHRECSTPEYRAAFDVALSDKVDA